MQPEDDSWDREVAEIVLAPHFGPEALAGLLDFSHIEVIFHFDREALVAAYVPRKPFEFASATTLDESA